MKDETYKGIVFIRAHMDFVINSNDLLNLRLEVWGIESKERPENFKEKRREVVFERKIGEDSTRTSQLVETHSTECKEIADIEMAMKRVLDKLLWDLRWHPSGNRIERSECFVTVNLNWKGQTELVNHQWWTNIYFILGDCWLQFLHYCSSDVVISKENQPTDFFDQSEKCPLNVNQVFGPAKNTHHWFTDFGDRNQWNAIAHLT